MNKKLVTSIIGNRQTNPNYGSRFYVNHHIIYVTFSIYEIFEPLHNHMLKDTEKFKRLYVVTWRDVIESENNPAPSSQLITTCGTDLYILPQFYKDLVVQVSSEIQDE